MGGVVNEMYRAFKTHQVSTLGVHTRHPSFFVWQLESGQTNIPPLGCAAAHNVGGTGQNGPPQ